MSGVLTAFVLVLFLAVAYPAFASSSESDSGASGGWLTMRLTASEIAQYAAAAGFEGDDLPVAVSIALAESSGKTDAYNPETAANTPEGLGSVGLWQIYLKVHPEYTREQLLDPRSNAFAAYSVYRQAGNSFRPWSTYKSGAYVAHLDDATAAVNA